MICIDAEQLQDGLYNIKDGKIYKYKAKGGTVRAYKLENRPQGEWIFDPEILCSDIGVYSAGYRCSVCGKDYFKVDGMNYCPNCGAKMKQ